MITESDVYQEHPGTTFTWALLASLLFNILAWVLALWLANVRLVLPQPQIQEREYQVSTTSMTLSRHIVPQQAHSVVPPAVPRPQREQQRQQQQHVAVTPTHAPPETPRPIASAAQHPLTVAESIQTQQQNLEKVAEEMRAARAPLGIATMQPRPPATYRQSFTINLPGSEPDQFTGLLTPVKSWAEGGLHCYYLHYIAQWSGGTSEQGIIPWQACYAAGSDPFPTERRTRIPAPPPGYRLPQDATIGPWLRGLYEAWLNG